METQPHLSEYANWKADVKNNNKESKKRVETYGLVEFDTTNCKKIVKESVGLVLSTIGEVFKQKINVKVGRVDRHLGFGYCRVNEETNGRNVVISENVEPEYISEGITHELGHALEGSLKAGAKELGFELCKEGQQTYADLISVYLLHPEILRAYWQLPLVDNVFRSLERVFVDVESSELDEMREKLKTILDNFKTKEED